MMLTVHELAQLLSIPEKKIYRLLLKNVIPYHKVGDDYRFNHVEVLEWATKNGMKVVPKKFSPSDTKRLTGSLLGRAMVVGGIVYDLPGTDKATVLHNMVDRIKLPTTADRTYLFEVLLAREKLGSTGIGDGIAIPHVRNPVIVSTTQPVVTLFFLQNPVEFSAPDSIPVTIIFSLISSGIKVHLQLLSQLSLALQDHTFRNLIIKKASPEEILGALEISQPSLGAAVAATMPDTDTPGVSQKDGHQ